MLVNTRSHLINVVDTPLWGVCAFGAARSGQRSRLRVATAGQAAPSLQRVRIHEGASWLRAVVQRGAAFLYERLYWNI